MSAEPHRPQAAPASSETDMTERGEVWEESDDDLLLPFEPNRAYW